MHVPQEPRQVFACALGCNAFPGLTVKLGSTLSSWLLNAAARRLSLALQRYDR
jgi:hypothetical protein